MKIRKIVLHNFRQYKNSEIEFSMDPVRNVTLVKGVGGSGKTTLTEAFRWCLYGSNAIAFKELLLNRDVENLLNDKGIVFTEVELYVEHRGNRYLIRRRVSYKRRNTKVVVATNKAGDREELIIINETTNRELSEDELYPLIHEMIPKDLAEYFFFDGEHMKSMASNINSGKGKDVGAVVKNLVGLSSLEELKKHLYNGSASSVMKDYTVDIDSTGGENFKKNSQEINRYQLLIDDTEKKLKENRNHYTKWQNDLMDVKNELANMKSIETLMAQRNEEENKRDRAKEKRIAKEGKYIKFFSNNLYSFLSRKLYENVLGSLDELKIENYGVPDVTDETIKYIMKHHHCICGNKILDGSEEEKELKKLLEYIPPKSCGTMIADFCDKAHEEIENNNEYVTTLTDDISEIDELRLFETECDNTILNYIETMNHQDEEVEKLNQRRSALEKNMEQLMNNFQQWSEKLGEYQHELELKETERKRMIASNKSKIQTQLYYDYAKQLQKTVDKIYKEQESNIRNSFEEKVNQLFYEIFGEKFTFSVNNKYNIVSNERLELSTSQRYSVVLAFIATTIDMARKKENKNEYLDNIVNYPLVMDAPLSAFSKKQIKNISELMPEIVEQLIIFIKDTDGDYVEEYMKDQIGKNYTIASKTKTYSYIEGVEA